MTATSATHSGREGIPDTLDALAVPVDSLKPYGRNPRQGDVGAIVASLERHGQYRPIVVNARTSEVLAGNHTLQAARQLGWTEIAATFVDVDDDTAARIVLIDNRSGSTLIACENAGRKCYAMELDPAYCDVIVDRWERHTGQTAELQHAA